MMPTTTVEEVKPKERRRPAPSGLSLDPTNIRSPTEIPPTGNQFLGVSPQGVVAVYWGTIPGDIDALPAAKELLATSPDTGGLSNADYVYKQLSALYGGNAQLPSFQSPSETNVEAIVFVSGSTKGGYGAFHIPGSQTEFDRIVVDSLNVTGNYSGGSSLGAEMAQVKDPIPHLFPVYRGPDELHGILHADDPRLERARPVDIRQALSITNQNTLALKTAVEHRNASRTPHKESSGTTHISLKNEVSDVHRLVHANRAILGLLAATAQARRARQYLSTALFAAELVESFQKLTSKADPKRTDGEAVSRVLAFKLAPEMALVTGFNSDVTQQWWRDGYPDYVTKNSADDQSTDGNGSGVMFLEFLTDYLGVPMDKILQHMPPTSGAPLAKTYEELVKTEYSDLAQVAGKDGASAFQAMTSLLKKHALNSDGTLNLPADGNPFLDMPGAKHGGLFAEQTSSTGTLAQDAQTALGLETQIDQQLTALKSTLQQIQSDLSGQPPAPAALVQAVEATIIEGEKAAFGYGPPLPSSILASLAQQAASYRAPQYDQALQQEFWPHVYNELPGTGPHTDRLEVITGTNQTPLAVQITGTIEQTKLQKDGDLHINFQSDNPNFPTNQGSGESPLEVEIIYAGPVSQQDAEQAEQNYANPFNIKLLGPGTRILAAGPLIFDRAHGKPTPDGSGIESGLEIHPLAGITILSGGPVPVPAPEPTTPTGQLSSDLTSALGQLATLNQTVGNMTSLIQKMKGEAPPTQG